LKDPRAPTAGRMTNEAERDQNRVKAWHRNGIRSVDRWCMAVQATWWRFFTLTCLLPPSCPRLPPDRPESGLLRPRQGFYPCFKLPCRHVYSVRLANIKPVVDAGCGASLTTVEPEEAPLATPPGQALSAWCGGGMERLVWQAARRGGYADREEEEERGASDDRP